MNQQIKQLAYSAKLDEHMLWTNAGMKLPDDMIKFADLIVQECIDHAHHQGHPDLELLLKHFGVES